MWKVIRRLGLYLVWVVFRVLWGWEEFRSRLNKGISFCFWNGR